MGGEIVNITNSLVFDGLETAINNIFDKYTHRSLSGIESISMADDFLLKEIDQKSIWNEMKKLGVPGYSIPLVNDGYELGQEVCLMICKQMGMFLFNNPYLDTMTAADLFLQSTSNSEFKDKLSLIVSGDLFVGVIGLDKNLINKTSIQSNGVWTINGTSHFVSNIDQLDSLLIILDDFAFEIPTNTSGIIVESQKDIANSNLNKVSFQQLELNLVDRINTIPLNLNSIKSRARLRQASYLLGLSKGALSEAVSYVNTRRQFGNKLISYQSVAFKLASLLAQIEAAEIKIQQTAWKQEEGQCTLQSATESLAYIAEISLLVSRETLHLHGAFGMTKLSKIENYYRSIALEAVRYGTPQSLWLEAGKLKIKSYENLLQRG